MQKRWPLNHAVRPPWTDQRRPISLQEGVKTVIHIVMLNHVLAV